MELSKLPKIIRRPAKRVGRGTGSGKGNHTTGRGQKGQKARGKISVQFEGTKVKKSLLKRLPMLRGKGKFKSWGQRYTAINLADLTKWPAKTPIDEENLVKAGIIRPGTKAKILAGGEAAKGLDVRVAISKKAAKMIEENGGKITGTV